MKPSSSVEAQPVGPPVEAVEGSELVIVVAPTARDAEATCNIFAAAGLLAKAAIDLESLEQQIGAGAGALIVTDATLGGEGGSALLRAVACQPSWSNLPVLALCRGGAPSPALDAALRELRNVTVLDRPVSTKALISATRAALRGRAWQYRIRDQLAELFAAQEALRLADRRKDEFMATLAHELRNPLAPIRTGLELLARVGHEQPRRERLVGMMDRQVEHLVRLIDDLMEVSRIASGKLELRCDQVDVRDVVRLAVEGCQYHLDQAEHRLTLALPSYPVTVLADATRLVQAVSNLLNNACKYTDRGGHITLTVSRHSDAGDAIGTARIVVQDDGLGLPATMIEHVFDMFTQVNNTLHRSQGGLGIGLALVRSVMRLHGGDVTAFSAGPGLGSRFTIELPQLAPDERSALPVMAQADPHSRAMRVLVVDDNADAAQALAMLLALDGHTLLIEHDGMQALAAAETFRPDAVFCDLGLPGMGGLEVAKALRAQPQFAHTLLVAVTGWGGVVDRDHSRDAGFDAHLTKPVNREAVTAALRGTSPADEDTAGSKPEARPGTNAEAGAS